MPPKTSPAIILLPISILLLNIWHCLQFLSNHGITIDWKIPPLFSPPTSLSRICQHNYSVEIMSIEPLVLYLNDFVTDAEIQHLLDLGKNRFAQSKVTHNNDERLDLTIRRSQTAFLPQKDPICACLTERMKLLLGNVQHQHVEGLQLVKYLAGGDTYRVHTDWADELTNHTDRTTSTVRQSRRLGSIFVYLEDDCVRGETFFPNLSGVSDSADGDKFALAEAGKGLLIKPRRRNGIFWNNLHANGSGDSRLAHAGLPIESGVKIGLNMWSTYYLDLPMVGGND